MKRLFDLTIICLFSPIVIITLILLALLVRAKLGAPVLFKQKRTGLNGEIFELIKFRSMCDIFDENGEALPDVERLTPFGKKLRSSSLDELPGLWNVLKGDMSLVGPRPLLIEYLPLYNAEQFRRHEIRPGITGWAQTSGRNAISWEDKFRLDVWYVDHQSFWLDIKILFITIKRVALRDGISQSNHVTMGKFKGSL